jgi:calcium-dependent protein kinase
MSPETMKGIYTSQADLWSVGVCTYIMLSGGIKPFESKTPKELVAKVLQGDYNFDDRVWIDANTSDEAKQLVRQLLMVDPRRRPSALDAMQHPWLLAAKDQLLDTLDPLFVQKIRDNMVRYANSTEFRKLALNVIAKKSTSDEIFELRKVFDAFDRDQTGYLTLQDFKNVLEERNYSDEDITAIFRKMVRCETVLLVTID